MWYNFLIIHFLMEIKTENINFFTKTLALNGYKASEIHNLLVTAWGEERIVTYRQIHRIHSGIRGSANCERAIGSGRPKTQCTEEKVESVREIVQGNDKVSIRQIEALIGISRSSVERILKRNLELHCVSATWVPHVLSPEQMENRVQCCESLKVEFSKRNASKNIIVCDEKWIYFRSTPNPIFIHRWIPKDGSGDQNRPQVARRSQSDRKVQMIFATNFNANCYYEFLEDGGTINSIRYIEFVQNAVASFNINNVQLHSMQWMHDNARPHISHLTREFFNNNGLRLLPQAAYSPDLNLCDRYIFRNFENFRRSQDFRTISEVKSCLDHYAQSLRPQSLKNEQKVIIDHCDNVIASQGSYV